MIVNINLINLKKRKRSVKERIQIFNIFIGPMIKI